MGDGVEKPEPGRSAKVRENHGEAGLRWCRDTIMGQVQDGARKPLLISPKTTTGQVRDGTKTAVGGCAMAREHPGWAGR